MIGRTNFLELVICPSASYKHHVKAREAIVWIGQIFDPLIRLHGLFYRLLYTPQTNQSDWQHKGGIFLLDCRSLSYLQFFYSVGSKLQN